MSDDARMLLIQQAVLRRALLVEAGYSTYRVGLDVHGEARGITCLCCGLTSYNPHDIEQRFCAACNAWHTEWVAAVDLRPVGDI